MTYGITAAVSLRDTEINVISVTSQQLDFSVEHLSLVVTGPVVRD